MNAPLAGLLVADLTQNVAGPFCTQTLGDMGAEVVKVERPGRGDDARAWAPPFWGRESATFMALTATSGASRSTSSREGARSCERLVARADVFVQSLRAGAIDELGLDLPRLAALNPRLVYCSITAFGTAGPLTDRPGYDPLMQAYGGLMSVNGHPGQEPARVPISIVDMGTGMWAALGIMAALRQRDRTGRGALVTTALFETALMWVSSRWALLRDGRGPAAAGLGHRHDRALPGVPHRRRLRDDRRGLRRAVRQATAALGVPELARDPRFADNPRRVEHRAALQEALARVTRGAQSGRPARAAARAGVPSARVSTMDQVPTEPQTEASGMLLAAPHPRLPDYRAVGLPIQWDGERPAARRVPPLLGEHTTDVLTGSATTRPPSGIWRSAMSSSYRTLNVTASDDGHVVTVTLNRPEQLNAMNTAMGEDLLAASTACARTPTCARWSSPAPATKAFCAGGDLKERNGMTDEAWRAQHVIFEQAAARVLRCPVPVIAAVEGFALAGGCELAILSDFIVAGETAVFGVPETTLGIFPGIGGTQLLPRILGAPLAKELIFTGRRMKAARRRPRAGQSPGAGRPGAGQGAGDRGHHRAQRPDRGAPGQEGDRLRQRDRSRDRHDAGHRGLQRHRDHRGPARRRPRLQREAQAQIQGQVDESRQRRRIARHLAHGQHGCHVEDEEGPMTRSDLRSPTSNARSRPASTSSASATPASTGATSTPGASTPRTSSTS